MLIDTPIPAVGAGSTKSETRAVSSKPQVIVPSVLGAVILAGVLAFAFIFAIKRKR